MVLRGCCSAVLLLRLEKGGWKSGGKSVSELNHRSPLAENSEQKIFTVRSGDLRNNLPWGDAFAVWRNSPSQPRP